METKKDLLVVKDKTIISFYQDNPNLDFITMNHIFIDILKKLSTNLNETITNNINHKILNALTDLSKDFNTFKLDFNKLNSEISLKLHESKKEYMEDIKLILSNNNLSSTEKINSILEKNNDTLLTKTNLIINDIVPKSQDKYYAQIENNIKAIHNIITNETHKLIENINNDDKTIEDYINKIDKQFSTMITNIQQPLFSFIQSSEERTNTSIQNINEKIVLQQKIQENLSGELNQFLSRYKHSSSDKGSISETELCYILQEIFPTDEVIETSKETAACDYKVNRLDKNKPTILFENKDYNQTVKTEEVKKFERDIQMQQHHGIFLSQNTNITFKKNFQIDIINGLIHVYIPNANYNIEKIRIAVDLIDHLSERLSILNNATSTNTTINILKEDIDELFEEYNNFTKQKSQLLEHIKTTSKFTIERLEELNISSIKKILNKNGLLLNEEDNKCQFCNSLWKGKASLSAHIRNCKFNPENKSGKPTTTKKTLNMNSINLELK